MKKFVPWFIVAKLIISASCGSGATFHRAELGADGWRTIGGTFSRTSENMTSGIVPPLSLVWKKQFMAGVAPSPLISEGQVLVAFLNGDLTGLHLRDGKKLFRKKGGHGPVFGLTIDGSVLYFGVGQEKKSFRAYDLNRRRYAWKVRLGAIESAPVVAKNRLFVGSIDHNFYCIDQTDGSIIWQKRVAAAVRVSPVFHSSRIIYADQGGNLYCRDGRNGRLIWKTELNSSGEGELEALYSHPVIRRGYLYVTSLGGNVYAIDATTGTTVWQKELGSPVYASISADSSLVFVPASSGQVFALKQQDGSLLWNYDAATIINTEIIVFDSTLLVTTHRGDMVFLQKETGDVLWSGKLDGRIVASPVAHSGFVIVADDRKWIYAFASGNVTISMD